MKNCIFCQIVAGKIPCFKVYEDKGFLGFLDINPFAFGHVLLIPKKHYRWVWQVNNPNYFKAAAKISASIIKVLGAQTVTYLSMGFLVKHAHLHLIPRKPNDNILTEEGLKREDCSKEKMLKISQKISTNV